MKFKHIIGLVGVSTVRANFLYYDCHQCIDNGGQQCLLNGDLNDGACCDPSVPQNQKTTFCKNQATSTYCATSDSIKHPYLQNFVCPASTDNCPKDEEQINIKLV